MIKRWFSPINQQISKINNNTSSTTLLIDINDQQNATKVLYSKLDMLNTNQFLKMKKYSEINLQSSYINLTTNASFKNNYINNEKIKNFTIFSKEKRKKNWNNSLINFHSQKYNEIIKYNKYKSNVPIKFKRINNKKRQFYNPLTKILHFSDNIKLNDYKRLKRIKRSNKIKHLESENASAFKIDLNASNEVEDLNASNEVENLNADLYNLQSNLIDNLSITNADTKEFNKLFEFSKLNNGIAIINQTTYEYFNESKTNTKQTENYKTKPNNNKIAFLQQFDEEEPKILLNITEKPKINEKKIYNKPSITKMDSFKLAVEQVNVETHLTSEMKKKIPSIYKNIKKVKEIQEYMNMAKYCDRYVKEILNDNKR